MLSVCIQEQGNGGTRQLSHSQSRKGLIWVVFNCFPINYRKNMLNLKNNYNHHQTVSDNGLLSLEFSLHWISMLYTNNVDINEITYE